MSDGFNQVQIDRYVEDADEGRIDAVGRWLRDGMPVDATVNKSVTALYCTAGRRNAPLMKLLLNAGARVNHVVTRGGPLYDDRTALNAAVSACSPGAVDLLLQHGADPRILDAKDNTAAHLLLIRASSYRDLPDGEIILNDLLARFLGLGVPVNQTGHSHRTLLHLAATADAPDLIVATLLTCGADVHAYDKEGLTPLHIAARAGQTDKIRMLVALGADPNVMSHDGFTPLRYAKDQDVGATLVELGADVCARDKMGRTMASQLLENMARCNGIAVSPMLGFLLDEHVDLDMADYSGQFSVNEVIDQQLNEQQAAVVKTFIAARDAKKVMATVIALRRRNSPT